MNESIKAHTIFVYGTLKPGGRYHDYIRDMVENPRNGTVKGELYDYYGKFPVLKPGEDANERVQGVMYHVKSEFTESIVHLLDQIEGYPMLFDRNWLSVTLNGRPPQYAAALTYFGNDPALFDYGIIKEGVWFNT
jgi:gamma-glutamylcyclotransferase (GGCT)/AIG2-like uncharacterized protein YtfP